MQTSRVDARRCRDGDRSGRAAVRVAFLAGSELSRERGGIALKVLEAMAMRKPVLSNSLGCEGIEVDHGHDVFLADGAVEFSDAVAHLLEDAATRRNLAENAYHTAEALYSWAVLANRFRDCYEAVIAERTSVKTMDAPDLQASAQAATRVN